MAPPDPQPSSPADPADLDAAAAAWLARHDAGLTPAEQAEFERWLATHPRRREVWREYTATWDLLEQTRTDGTADLLVSELAARQRRRRWRVLAGAAGFVTTAAAAAFFLFARPSVPALPAEAPPAPAVLHRPDQQTLADGTVVELNAGAEIAAEFTPAERRVRLVRGEAHFAVAKNPARPFVVVAGGVAVRAVGTAFAVKLGSESVDVLVTEGRVAVEEAGGGWPLLAAPNPATPEAPVLQARQRVTVPREPAKSVVVAEAVAAPEIEQRLAWRGPRLELSGTPVAAAVAILNRENRLQIALADPEVAALRLSGLFRADNAETFVRILEDNYGIRAERRGEREVVLRAQR